MNPNSIQVWEAEKRETHQNLDFGYIDRTAAEAARLLVDRAPVEVNYQPGDWTRYGLFIFGLAGTSVVTVARKPDLSFSAVDGISRDGSWFMVCRQDDGCYPFQLAAGGWKGLAASYVAGRITKGNAMSGVSVTLLLRAIGYHIDQDPEFNLGAHSL